MRRLLLCFLVPLVFSCKSVPPSSYMPKIFGGILVKNNEFQHHVGLGIYRGDVFCGGTILNVRFVISAAHCKYLFDQSYQDRDMGVLAGTKVINQNQGSWYKVKKTILHPKWDPDSYEFDILLLMLNRDIRLIPHLVDVVQLPGKFTHQPQIGSKVWTCGWGLETENSRSERLKKIDFHTVSEEDCIDAWGTATQKRICVFSTQKGWGTCNGDSGGGLIFKEHLIGILSYGTMKCNENALEVYTDVHVYIDWIKNIID